MGIEDEIKLEDVLKEPTELIMAKIYVQTLKTNGIVKQHETDIICLKNDMKKKISNTVFGIGAGIIGLIILLFQVLDYLKQ
jgi:hypothetical protein